MKKQTAAQRNKKLVEAVQNARTYKGEWYTMNSIMGNDWAWGKLLLGGWEVGKSYAAMEWSLARKMRLKAKFKLYWMRLTDIAVKNMLENDATGVVDSGIVARLGLHITRVGKKIFTYKPKTDPKTGKEKKENLKELMELVSCSTFFNDKGKAHYDQNFDGEYCIVLDEMNREEFEANRFDIVYAFARQIENLVRSERKCKINVIMIGNNTDEASDLLAAFNFIPEKFGRYKLKSRGIVVDYIRPNEKYSERREGAIANKIIGNNTAATTNEYVIDRSLLVNKRYCQTPQSIIKFGKTEDLYFTLWNNNIIKDYNRENVPAIAMKRYLDERFDPDLMHFVFDAFDARAFKFANLSTLKRFQKNLRLLKRTT